MKEEIAMARTELRYVNGLARIYEDATCVPFSKNGNVGGKDTPTLNEWEKDSIRRKRIKKKYSSP